MAQNPVLPMTITTPARVCLFGDHQDYLGLPIIAGAIDRHMTFEVAKNDRRVIVLDLADLGQKRELSLQEEQQQEPETIDFFKAGLRVAARYGCHPTFGLNVRITSTIPINAGISSSSALTVGWIKVLLYTFGCNASVTPALIGQLAYQAEVLEHNSPGGQMDQYTIAHGGLIFLETGKDLKIKPLPDPKLTMVLAESGIGKDTLGTIGQVRTKAQEAIAIVQKFHPDFDLKIALPKDVSTYLKRLEPGLHPFFEAAINNHNITQKAKQHLTQSSPNPKKLGALMTAHHKQLRDLLELSHPKIDALIETGLSHGAYGAKIVGSGHGGCALFLTNENQAVYLVDHLKKAGAKDAYRINITSSHGA